MSTVLKDFKCKVSKIIYKKDSVYDGDRLEELQNMGYVSMQKSQVEEQLSEDESEKELDNDIEEVDESHWPKHVGGGYYELSNGEKVRGKDIAIAAQIELDK